MTITKNNMVYESPDNGKTIYGRLPGSTERVLIYKQKWKSRWYEWDEILKAAEDNPALNDAICKAEMLYELVKVRPAAADDDF